MTPIGVYDAKTQLPRLLTRVSRGESFLITKHGRPVARLLPAESEPSLSVAEVIREMEDWQKNEAPTLGPDLSLRELIESGRRL